MSSTIQADEEKPTVIEPMVTSAREEAEGGNNLLEESENRIPEQLTRNHRRAGQPIREQ